MRSFFSGVKDKNITALRANQCIVLSTVMVLLFSGCFAGGSSSTPNRRVDLNELAKVEVKEYQGVNLSSITSFQDEAINGIQYIEKDSYKLKIDGLVENPAELTYDEILSNTKYKKAVTLNCVEGWSVHILWEGILLKDIFDKVKVKSNANTVIFYASDGYSTALPLQTVLDKNMIIAYKINDIVLPVQMGYPFQLVAEDKLGYKWIKWLTHIELSDDSGYLGYWEKEGYSNDADAGSNVR